MQNKPIKVLIACECSGIIRDAFLALGCDAWSCDIKPCEKGSNRHIRADVLTIIDNGWDLIISHPPCQYLSYAGSRVWNKPGRAEKRAAAMVFFMQLYNAKAKYICVENPLGEPITHVKPSQVIHPYYFGDEYQKRTCLWLRGLPCLEHYKVDTLFNKKTWVGKGELEQGKDGKVRAAWSNQAYALPKEQRQTVRSMTFQGIADAMAAQWVQFISNQ
jgi:hypothetical protein